MWTFLLRVNSPVQIETIEPKSSIGYRNARHYHEEYPFGPTSVRHKGKNLLVHLLKDE